jgi:hypothetical protein
MTFPIGRKKSLRRMSNHSKLSLRLLIPLLIQEGARGWLRKRSAGSSRGGSRTARTKTRVIVDQGGSRTAPTNTSARVSGRQSRLQWSIIPVAPAGARFLFCSFFPWLPPAHGRRSAAFRARPRLFSSLLRPHGMGRRLIACPGRGVRPFWPHIFVDLLTEYAGVDAAEQEKRCGLTIDRVRWPVDENARIRKCKPWTYNTGPRCNC